MKCVTVQLEDELADWLRRHAATRYCSMSQVIKDQLVVLMATTPAPPLPPADTAHARVISVAEAKRRAKKGGRK